MRLSAVILACAVIPCAQASFFDLRADFSDTNNPNGVWRLEKNINTLFAITQADYWSNGTNQKAWADQPYDLLAHVPFWYKATSLVGVEYELGDVVMHGAVSNRTGSVNTSAVWVSPQAGVAIMSGHTWMTRNIGRQMDWQLFKNAAMVSSGHMGPGTTSRNNPFLFLNGSGGVAALTQTVAAGDRLELRFHSLDLLPDIAGVEYSIELVPEPATLAALGLGVLALMRRRKA